MPPSKQSNALAQLGVIGINWRQGGAQELARFSLPREDEPLRIARLAAHLGVDELVYVATCNRVEIFFRTDGPADVNDLRSRAFVALTGANPEAGEAARCMRAWAGEGAAEHIFLVAAGLDSAEVGETEIHGQLKRALDLALECGSLPNRGSQLETIVSEALKLSRRLRQENQMGTGRMSLAEIAMDKFREHVAHMDKPTVLLIGVSPMNERCATSLAQAGTRFVIANRTKSRADDFAKAQNRLHSGICTASMSLDELRSHPPAVDAVLSATASSEPILNASDLAKLLAVQPSKAPLLIIDFAVPPDVDPEVVRRINAHESRPIQRVGMQSMIETAAATRGQRLEAAASAREAIDAALDRLATRIAGAHVAPFVSALQNSYRSIAKHSAEDLLAGKLQNLNESERAAVIQFADKLAGRFAHLPSTGLFGVARVGGPAAVDAFLARADRELGLEFERAAASQNRPTE